MAYSLAPQSEWQTYGGRDRHSYHAPISGGNRSVHGSPGTYMIDPLTNDRGRHIGYRVLFCDAGGDLTAQGKQTGLYAQVAPRVTLPAARKAVREHFAQNFSA